jgi:WD40 repeat protein
MAAPTPHQHPLRVFYSYSHRDERLLEKLKTHLQLLRREGLIREWHDRMIGAGTEWKDSLDEHLDAADIILLLVSADFIASDYCYDREMTRALEKHEAGTARVIPVILRPVDWHSAPFGRLQALPINGKPVTSWPNRDEAWTSVAQGLRQAIQQLADAQPFEAASASVDKQARSTLAAGTPTSPDGERDTNSTAGLRYLNFDLDIGMGQGREYPLAVVQSPAGELLSQTLRFPFDELALENRLKDLQIALLRSGGQHRRIPSREEQAVQGFGRALFDALFTERVRSLYVVSRNKASETNHGLRIRLRIRPPELAALPWEFLYDSDWADFICLSRYTPVARYVELPQPAQPLAVTLPLRILGMIASPTNLAALDVATERARVEKALEPLSSDGLIELHWLDGSTWRDLQRAMRRGPWHIFHFVGHGGFEPRTDEGFIALEDDTGRARELSATELGRLLAGERSLRLVVLNSCEGAHGSTHDIFSSTAVILVQRGIPAVLAMQYEITDRAAIELARTFYEALVEGLPVDAALGEARIAISQEIANTVEWGTPVLYMRSADGLLFTIQRLPTVPAPQQTSRPQGQRRKAVDPTADTQRVVPKYDGKEATGPPPDVNVVHELWRLEGHGGSVKSVAFSPDGRLLASGSEDKTVRLWEVDGGREVRRLEGHRKWVASVAFSPDGRLLASGSGDETVRLWQVTSGREVRRLEGHGGTVKSVAFSPDGRTLASGSTIASNRCRLWDAVGGRELLQLKATSVSFWRGLFAISDWYTIAFSPDGRTLASGGDDSTVRLWEVDGGREVRRLEGHRKGVTSVAFSPDGRLLASGGDDSTVRLWEVTSGREVRRLEGHGGTVKSVAFSPDGRLLASGSGDNMVRLWEVDGGRALRRLEGHDNIVWCVAFSPDGCLLASGGGDTTVRLWAVQAGT